MAHTQETGRRPLELVERDAAKTWTEERLAELRQLWVEENLSSTEISQRMGISRGTVMGKINRLGLLRHRGTPIVAALSSEEEVVVLGAAEDPDVPATPSATESAMDEVSIGQHPTIFQLRTSHCRFPLGSFKESVVFFCGKPAELPKPYCRECCQRAYTVTRPRGA